MDFRIGMIQGTLKVLDETLAPLHPRIGSLNNPPCCNGNKAHFAFCCFLSLGRLERELEANLRHDLRVKQFERHLERVGMVAVVKQNRDLGKVHGLGAKVVEMVNQHLNQPLVISHTCLGAVREERQS